MLDVTGKIDSVLSPNVDDPPQWVQSPLMLVCIMLPAAPILPLSATPRGLDPPVAIYTPPLLNPKERGE